MRRYALALLATSALSFSLGQAASAADLGKRVYTKAPPPVAAPVLTNWSGFYVGAHGGWGWSRKAWGDNSTTCLGSNATINAVACAPDLGSHTASGWLAGAQAGFNLQKDNWVFGIEGQFSFSDLDGDHSRTRSVTSADGLSTFTGIERLSTQVRDLGTLAGRVGFAAGATGNVLFFAKGGGAFAYDRFQLDSSGACTGPCTTFPASASAPLSATQTRFGFMVGGGIEAMLLPNWSIKAEYNYLGFGKQDVTFTGTACITTSCTSLSRVVSIDQNIQLVKFGINYHFGAAAAPVSAKY